MLKNKTAPITEKEIIKICRNVFDEVTIRILINEFEDTLLISAVMKLRKLERIIVVLNVVIDMTPSEIAFILGTNTNSVYVQKQTALKKLKEFYLQEKEAV